MPISGLPAVVLFCFVFSPRKSAYDDEHCDLTVLFSRPIWELATADARRKWRDDLEQMKLNEPGKSKLKRMKLLAMYETYMGIFLPTPDYKGEKQSAVPVSQQQRIAGE